jgi:glycosyltransferase involved in cell wall biosynthesis
LRAVMHPADHAIRILVDTERLRNPNNGLGQLCRRLGEELVRLRPSHAELTFLVPDTRRGVFGSGVDYAPPQWWKRVWPSGSFDVWHATHQDSAFVPSRRSRLVLTILDLNFLERSDYGADKKQRRLANVQRKVNRASAIATISAYTASVVREHLRVPEIPLQVIYLGNPTPPGDTATTRPRAHSTLDALSDSARFLLFVGVLHPKKNVHTLLPALAHLPGRTLVLAGPDGHAYANRLRETAASLGLEERVVIPGAVDETTKHWLYEHCEALVFPSLSEGFGLPVLEAMAHGKPVFLSRLTSLPEIGGTEAFYFESFDPADMAETIRGGLDQFEADRTFADRLRRRAAQFSWEETARAYWALYHLVAR